MHPDKLKPYKKDLEYLDDHFQVNTHTNADACTYTHTCIHTYTHIHMYICTCTYIHTELYTNTYNVLFQYICCVMKVKQCEVRMEREVSACDCTQHQELPFAAIQAQFDKGWDPRSVGHSCNMGLKVCNLCNCINIILFITVVIRIEVWTFISYKSF